MTKSSSTSLNSLLEETNTFDNSLPESETFCFDLEEISSGSTTTRSDISLPDYEAFYDHHVKEISSGSTTTHSDSSLYDSFIFDLSINPFPPADRSDFYKFADELAHIISPPEYDCSSFRNEPNSGDFTMDVVEDTFPRRVHVHNVLPTYPTLQLNLDFILFSESLFTYVVWIFLLFLSYSAAPQYLLSFRNEDTIFDPVSVGCQKPGHLAARLGCVETKVVTWDDLAFKLITLGWNVKHKLFCKNVDPSKEAKSHCVHRMHVDGGSSAKILYEHCFSKFRPEIKNQLLLANTPLVGFSGEIIWPLGQISLLVKIGDEEHSTSAWMNFMVVRSPSPYNGIIRRPVVRNIRAIPSTAHRMLKFPVAGGIFALRSSRIIRLECSMVSEPGAPRPKPADMTGVPRQIDEHRLNIREGCLPVRQKKSGQAPERNKAEADILKEVHYHSWLSNLVMVDADGLRVCPDKVEAVLNLSSLKCLKDVQKLNGKLASLNRFMSKSAEKSLRLFKALKKCTKKSDFQWTAEAEMAFKGMKQLIDELPMLTAPKEKEELVMYLAAAKEAIGAVLMTERTGSKKGKQKSMRRNQGTVMDKNKNWVEEISYVLWAHRTMIKSSNEETPFSLTYGAEAVIPAEIGMPTLRMEKVDMVKNNEALWVSLNLLEEKIEQVAIQEVRSKAKRERYYNAKVRSISFRPGDFVYRSNKANM
nr:reverse transcriptase domain-containing protein [Tanacetum cinerariifolium]